MRYFRQFLKVSCCRIYYLEITTIWWVRCRLKNLIFFFLWKRWTSRTVQDQTPNWSFRAQCTQHQTANEPRGTLAEASKELPHNKTACCVARCGTDDSTLGWLSGVKNSRKINFRLFWILLCTLISLSRVSIIRPGCSSLLEFEKRQYWSFNRDFFPNIQTRWFNSAHKLAVAALQWNSRIDFFWDGPGRLIETS